MTDVGAHEAGEPPSDIELGRPAWSKFGLSLTSGQLDTVRLLTRRASHIEPSLTRILTTVLERCPRARLEGLEHRLKSLDSTARKLADRPGPFPSRGLPRVVDSVRYTVVVPDESFTADTQHILHELGLHGLRPRSLIDTFGLEGYQGVNTRWQTPSGVGCEVQFHTPLSRRMCELTHGLYEQVRLSTTSEGERAMADNIRRTAFTAVPEPPGHATLTMPKATVSRRSTPADVGRSPELPPGERGAGHPNSGGPSPAKRRHEDGSQRRGNGGSSGASRNSDSSKPRHTRPQHRQRPTNGPSLET